MNLIRGTENWFPKISEISRPDNIPYFVAARLDVSLFWHIVVKKVSTNIWCLEILLF